MNQKKLAYILILLSTLLLILNISILDFENLKDNSYFGIISNLLLILAMILTIRGMNKQEK